MLRPTSVGAHHVLRSISVAHDYLLTRVGLRHQRHPITDWPTPAAIRDPIDDSSPHVVSEIDSGAGADNSTSSRGRWRLRRAGNRVDEADQFVRIIRFLDEASRCVTDETIRQF